MKRIPIFISFAILSLVIYGGNPNTGQGRLDNPVHEREQIRPETPQPTINRAPLRKSTTQAGHQQFGFRSGETGYAWNVFGSDTDVPTGPVTVSIPGGTIASIAEVSSQQVWMIGGDFSNDTWYAVAYHPSNSGLFTVDFTDGTLELIGPMGHSITGLAWDPASDIMYASGVFDDNSYLYTVDILTGAATLVGEITNGLIIGVACDMDGNIFGIDLADSGLYSINSQTGVGSLIGELGIAINFAQDIAYDRNNSVLYGTLYEATQETGGFYEINTQTGTATLIHNFVAELAGFAIPYSLADDGAPGPVANYSIQAGAEGALQAHLSWTNPALTFGGEPLTDLTSVIVERNGEVIHTINNPVSGGNQVYTDASVPDTGIHTYHVYGVNSTGQGPKRSFSLYIGVDVPAGPANINLVAAGDNGHISWDPPSEGLNGGYSGQNINYSITRQPDNIVVAENITATEYLDTTVPGIGNYYYTITAGNHIGQGGTAASNYALLASGDVLLYEDFNYPIGMLPPGWVLDDTQHEWSVSESSMAGGQVPELRLGYSHAWGSSRLIIPPVNIEGHQYLSLSFKQYLINYEADNSEVIGFDVSFDGGQSWEVIWEKAIGMANIHQGKYEYFISVPDDITEIKLAVRFDGYSYLINQWYIDDIVLKPVGENDLAGMSVSGNSTPIAGVETFYNVEVVNSGSNAQSDYTVKLMKEGGTELASVAGDPISFGQKIVYQLPWTPQEGDVGATVLYGYVDLQADEQPDNNQTSSLTVRIQPEDIMSVDIGNGAEPLKFQPYNFFTYHSLTQTVYFPEEIGLNGGVITGIKYFNSFDEDTPEIPIQIWLGETENPDLTEQWVDPGTLEMVFDGLVSFPKGANEIYIPLDEVYMYNGGNLVVYSHKTHNENHLIGRAFHSTHHPNNWRSRIADSQGDPFDPLNPVSWGYNSQYYPNITFLFSTTGIGVLEGIVSENGEPLPDVDVHITGSNTCTTTGHDGLFRFPAIQAGIYNLEFSKHGYDNTILEDVVVVEYETTTVAATMNAIPTITLTGKVAGSENPQEGIQGATILLSGYQEYEAQSSAGGHFVVEGVYSQQEYSVKILAPGYETHTGMVEAGSSDQDMGNIVLTQIAFPVGEVLAAKTAEGALVNWNAPGSEFLLKLYQHDGDVPEVPDALYQFSDYVYGTIFDISDYPDAKISFMDFHHMQWGSPEGVYPYLAHIVDWENFEILTTIGPLSTQVNDDWELEISLGHYDVGGKKQIGIFIQAQGGSETDAYPCITADGSPDGLSVLAPVADLSAYEITGNIGDFLINMWITTSYSSKGLIKADGITSDNVGTTKSRRGVINSSTSGSFSQNAHLVERDLKAFQNYRIYRLSEGSEDNIAEWAELHVNLSDTFYLDSGWDGLQQGGWMYAVVAEYTNENLSDPEFSNILIKDASGQLPITFEVSMELVEEFDPDHDRLYIAGILNWETPGDEPQNQLMSVSDHDPLVYTITLYLQEGDYEYKYFLNEGWDGGEWEGEPNREISITEEVTIFDIFGLPGGNWVAETQEPFSISMFPNPVKNILNVKAEGLMLDISMIDILGQEVYSYSVRDYMHEINVGSLKPGLYFVQVLTSHGIITKRVQVIK